VCFMLDFLFSLRSHILSFPFATQIKSNSEKVASKEIDMEAKTFRALHYDMSMSMPTHGCQIEFILWDADANVALRPLAPVECVMDHDFSIQALPSAACPETKSASMKLTGPIDRKHTENRAPYMVFGDKSGIEINGRSYRDGHFSISTQLFSERHLDGDLVVERTFDFTVIECSRRLRGNA